MQNRAHSGPEYRSRKLIIKTDLVEVTLLDTLCLNTYSVS